MLFDIVQNFHPKIMGHHIFGGDKVNVDELSPVSALRLNFDQLANETTDEEVETKNIFGVAVPQFVSQRVISWMGNSVNGSESVPDTDVTSNASAASASNNNEQLPCVSRKVCPFVCIFAHFAFISLCS